MPIRLPEEEAVISTAVIIAVIICIIVELSLTDVVSGWDEGENELPENGDEVTDIVRASGQIGE